MAMKPCKECGEEISSSANKCPKCGKDQRNFFMKHKILSVIGILIVLGIIGSLIGGNDDKTTVISSGNNTSTNSNNTSTNGNSTSTETVAKVGDVIKTGQFEITITSIQERSSVGTQIFNSNPAEGGTYVAVNWKYKNISDKPINSFSTPSIKIVDKNDTKYDSDIGASSSYATELNLDEKILSDLNPGITVKDADVFEIAKEQYATGGYRLLIQADDDIYININ